ncbi:MULTISPECIES: type VII secretion target [Prauserella salsuginis group]|uniref:Type VII secretion target n=1 Tax=Prauserella salsuginis TaxID=387889 RepID=A0ABW6FZ83_9PSEU|nr:MULTISPECIES: type VII secretion target [Prauserella salsuginis group]MCR3720596.1 Excreted virulence factor EspC, type VII ESX diderm [Prauserella flava]MCR3733694.1 Excreted virulence factor EspC, type VII ESX diderm [Prauserella salsuginis]
MGFEAKIGEIASSSEAAGDVAAAVRKVDPASVLPGGDAGMPGSEATAKLARVKESWKGKGVKTASALEQYAQNLATAAEQYRSSDAAAEEDLTPRTGHSGGQEPI